LEYLNPTYLILYFGRFFRLLVYASLFFILLNKAYQNGVASIRTYSALGLSNSAFYSFIEVLGLAVLSLTFFMAEPTDKTYKSWGVAGILFLLLWAIHPATISYILNLLPSALK